MDDKQKKHFPNREIWRRWLEKNGDSEKGIWMIFYKKHTGVRNVSYDEAVEEAICFGWIDSVVKRVDDQTYIQKFTPRNPKSKWSAINVKRAKKMIDENKMTESALENFNNSMEEGLVNKKKRIDKIPEFILNRIKKESTALKNFDNLTTKQKMNFAHWILDAKKEETRLRRLEKAIDMLKQNKKLGMI